MRDDLGPRDASPCVGHDVRRGATDGYAVRELGPQDWQSHRDLRLEMLAEAPGAFWATYEETAQRTEEQWRQELAGPRVHFQARAIDARGHERAEVPPAGGIALLPQGYHDEHVIDCDQSIIVSLWVRPSLRGRGISRLLWKAVADRALQLDRPRLLLDVDDSNLAAIRSYERIGFVATGHRYPREGTGTRWVEYAADAAALRLD